MVVAGLLTAYDDHFSSLILPTNFCDSLGMKYLAVAGRDH
jgi:hypothetical protein